MQQLSMGSETAHLLLGPVPQQVVTTTSRRPHGTKEFWKLRSPMMMIYLRCCAILLLSHFLLRYIRWSLKLEKDQQQPATSTALAT